MTVYTGPNAEEKIVQQGKRLEKQENDMSQLKAEQQRILKENVELRTEMSKLNSCISGNASRTQEEEGHIDNVRESDRRTDAEEPNTVPARPIGAEPKEGETTAPVTPIGPEPKEKEDTVPAIPIGAEHKEGENTVPATPIGTDQAQPPPTRHNGTQSQISEPSASGDASADGSRKPQRKRLSQKEKTEARKIYEESALSATFIAASQGIPREQAINIGRTTGSLNAQSFAQAAKKNNANIARGAMPRSEFPQLTSPTLGSGNKVVLRNKLSKAVPYKRGKVTVNNQSMSRQRPSFMNNKCLVIRGLRKGISLNQCVDYIEKTAGRKINILHIEPISREYSPWMTVAIELDLDDYELLSDINIWETSIGIRDYVGWCHWHGERPKRLAPHEIRNSVRMSWAKDSSSTL